MTELPEHRACRAKIEEFARELVGELMEIQGQELRVGGKTYLVTTEAQIAEWIAWHVHNEDDEAYRTEGKRTTTKCLCGKTFTGTFVQANGALDAHRAEMVADYKGGKE